MRRGQFALVFAALILILTILVIRLQGPDPQGAAAGPGEFSAVRAREVLDDVLREQQPHWVGSPANAVVRDRILARFKGLGYQTNVQRTFVCNARPTCATVENILASSGGQAPALSAAEGPSPVLVAAHYDSVASGPGASDDGVGFATALEIARAVTNEQHKHPINFLITDGEEPGLLGAEAFVAKPTAVHAIVNVENRGTSGPSYLFETSRGNGELISAARAIKRPFASSLFYTIYDLLPNDTDATIFKRADMRVMNFGAIDNVAYYHTPLDNLAHVDNRTFQHHGDNALAAARALADRDLGTSKNAVYFDVLGFAIVQWPEPWTLPIIGVSFVILLLQMRGSRPRDVFLGILLLVGSVVLAAGVAFCMMLVATARSEDATWVAYPQAAIAAMWLSGVSAAMSFRWQVRKGDWRAIFIGVGIGWHLLSLTAATFLPGVSHLFLVPAVVCTITARTNDLTRSLVSALAAAILFFPVGLVLYTALGKTGLVPIAVLIAFVAISLPVANGRVIAVTFGIAVVCALVAMILPTYTASNPRRDPITIEIPAAINVSASRDGAKLTLRLRSTREADQVSVALPPGTRVVRVNGVEPAAQNPRRTYRAGGVMVYGRDALIELHAPKPIEITASDTKFTPQKRDWPDVVTSGRGDVTVSRRKGTY